jgi:hypothetical protein
MPSNAPLQRKPTLLEGNIGKILPKFENAYFAEVVAGLVTVVQEWLAVTFQLVCLSRLETTADIKSTLVLFLTLVVFTGPFLNLWLLFTYKTFIQHWDFDWTVLVHLLLAVLIACAHLLGSATAKAIIEDWEPKAKLSIDWTIQNKLAAKESNNNLSAILLEEMFAVSSLLIGYVYLLWLKEIKKDKPEKKHEKGRLKIEIKFYFHLTLLVAAVGQAFPSAYLSPHIAFFKLMMQRIEWDVFGHRIAGGLVGFVISSIWCCCRMNYRHAIQASVPKENEHHTASDPAAPAGGYSITAQEDYGLPTMHLTDAHGKTLQVTPGGRKMPAIRLSMHGDSYF